MPEVLSIMEALDVLRKSTKDYTELYNDSFDDVDAVISEMETSLSEPHSVVKYHIFKNHPFNEPVIHPPVRDKLYLDKRAEGVLLEKGTNEHPGYMEIKFKYEEDLLALYVTYARENFEVRPERYRGEGQFCAWVKRKDNKYLKHKPDIVFTEGGAQFRLENDPEKMILPLEYFWKKMSDLDK